MSLLIDSLNRQCVMIGTQASTKDELLKECARCMKNSPNLETIAEDEIYSALKKREKLGSTGFGNAIAIPHCSFDSIDTFTIGTVTHADGIDFDSLDGKPTSCFVIIVGPSSKKNEHIHLLSRVSRILNSPHGIDTRYFLRYTDLRSR